MRGLNKVILIGYLGRDPDYREDMKRASFSLATTESYNDKNGQRVDITDWHNIVVWGNLADVAIKYLKRGAPLYLEGRIKNRSYDDGKGNKKYITEIRCDSFIMLGRKRDDSEEGNETMHGDNINYQELDSLSVSQPEDDLPF